MENQRSPRYISSIIGSAAPNTVVLTNSQAQALSYAAKEDALGAYQLSCMSYAEAVSGLVYGGFSWATVKLYYSLFYLLKSRILNSGVCVFYHGTTPWSLEALAGAMPKKGSGNSHVLVRKRYSDIFPVDPICTQEIEFKKPMDWMAGNREMVNYRYLRMVDPLPPEWFNQVSKDGVRRLSLAYHEDVDTYAFDKDHASLAMGYYLLKSERDKYLAAGVNPLSKDDSSRLLSLCADSKGVIHSVNSLFDYS